MSKYKNTKYGGYDSKKEARRGAELDAMLAAGDIQSLEKQKVFLLLPRQVDLFSGKVKERAVTYVADFCYREMHSGVLHVEDVKSAFTRKLPAYVLKRKMMLALLGITIEEV